MFKSILTMLSAIILFNGCSTKLNLNKLQPIQKAVKQKVAKNVIYYNNITILKNNKKIGNNEDKLKTEELINKILKNGNYIKHKKYDIENLTFNIKRTNIKSINHPTRYKYYKDSKGNWEYTKEFGYLEIRNYINIDITYKYNNKSYKTNIDKIYTQEYSYDIEDSSNNYLNTYFNEYSSYYLNRNEYNYFEEDRNSEYFISKIELNNTITRAIEKGIETELEKIYKEIINKFEIQEILEDKKYYILKLNGGSCHKIEKNDILKDENYINWQISDNVSCYKSYAYKEKEEITQLPSILSKLQR